MAEPFFLPQENVLANAELINHQHTNWKGGFNNGLYDYLHSEKMAVIPPGPISSLFIPASKKDSPCQGRPNPAIDCSGIQTKPMIWASAGLIRAESAHLGGSYGESPGLANKLANLGDSGWQPR